MASKLTNFLEKLGLTEYEARTLESLFTLHEAFAPEISRQAQVPKTRVYDVLERLMGKQLIIEVYGRPKKYKTLNPSRVLSILIENKKNEISDLEKQTEKLLSDLDFNAPEAGSERVMKVRDQNDFIKILSQEIENANESIVGFTKISKPHSQLKDAIRKASKKADVRFIHKNLEEDFASELISHGVSLKESNHSLNAYLIDGKKVILALSDFEQEFPEYHFTIVENNPSMAQLLQSYFESNWK